MKILCCLLCLLLPATAFSATPARAPQKAIAAPPDTILALRLDTFGIGAQLQHTLSRSISIGGYFTAGSTDLHPFGGGDRIDEHVYGLQLRLHPGGHAPRGFYLLGDLAYVDASFERSAAQAGRTASSLDDGFKPALGLGYQALWSTLALDVGLTLGGPKVSYSASYGPASNSSTSSSGNAYLGLGWAF